MENNEYCQQVIRSRIADRLVPAGRVCGDIAQFTPEGDEVNCDGIAGGFPCQASRLLASISLTVNVES